VPQSELPIIEVDILQAIEDLPDIIAHLPDMLPTAAREAIINFSAAVENMKRVLSQIEERDA